jgi:Peptidase family M23/RTX calcium-binding nonapeptide repeat (4 copies)
MMEDGRRWAGSLAVLAVIAAGMVAAPPAGADTTALVVRQSGPALAAPASDGRVHVEYDLVLTNIFYAPVTLTSVEVLVPGGRVVLRLEGEALAAVTQPVPGGAPTTSIPVSGAVDIMIDVVLPPGPTPERFTHRITYELPSDAPELALIDSRVIRGPRVDLDPRRPLVVAPPLSGDGWFAGSGCCAPNLHRSIRLADDGSRLIHPETFAIDWIRIEGGSLFRGDGTALEDHFAFGAVVTSATGGVVVSARDDMPEETPFQAPQAIRKSDDYGGNHVIVRVRPDVYAAYGHVQPGSVAVEEGERVTTGQRLGLLGNTGNSTAPHLHFGLIDGPDLTGAYGLPFVIDRYRLEAALPAEPESPTGIRLEGPSGPREKAYPLLWTVVEFRDARVPRCGGRLATITATEGADRLIGTPGRDVIHTGGGDDRVDGAGGADLVCGGQGADRLDGGAGRDRILGGPDPDDLDGGPGRDRLRGGPGRDRREQ